ncbi:MAG: T9SS type A sorting domain-containing protein [Saprospiraceae bacterium]
MKKQITFILIFLCQLFIVHSTFSQPKAMVIGFNDDNPEGVTIVAIQDMPASTNLYLTETDYDATNNDFNRNGSNDGTWKITWTGTWTAGTVLELREVTSNSFTAFGGPSGVTTSSPYGDLISLSLEGYSLYISDTPADPDNDVDEIYSYFSGASTLDPNPGLDSDCPCTPFFIGVHLGLPTNIDYAEYSGDRSVAVTAADLQSAGNWASGTAFVGLDLTAFSGGILPIELGSFKAEKFDSEVRVHWETISETNNEYFSIEHSSDGERFESIGLKDGAGNTTERQFYTLKHKNPITGLNYYRLKQVDFDRKFSYSNIEVVNFDEPHSVGITPNPFLDEIKINLEKSYTRDTQFNITDITGKIVYTGLIEKDQLSTIINLSNLQSGVFILRIGNGDNATSQRIVKL